MDDKLMQQKWDELTEIFPEIKLLKGVPQDAEYHGEGDVLTHTKLVWECLNSSADFMRQSSSVKHVLETACLFHDIGKARTTRQEEGKIISPRHALLGEQMTRSFMYRQHSDIPVSERECIAKLVRYHGLPIHWCDKRDSEKYMYLVSQSTNLYLLYLLSTADCSGRICHDAEALKYSTELFREFADEKGCLHELKRFPNDLSRYEYFLNDARDVNYAAYENYSCDAILMSGLPASGKDSWIEKYSPNWPVISLDAVRQKLRISPTDNQGPVISAAKEEARRLLRQGQSFVWNATNITKDMRTPLVKLFADYGACVKIVYVETPYRDLLNRNSSRKRTVNAPAIERLIDKLNPPTIEEAHKVEYYQNTGGFEPIQLYSA